MPVGVPVTMTVPFSIVVPVDRKEMMCGMSTARADANRRQGRRSSHRPGVARTAS